jgi:uncharacterized protein (DUF433 family)
MDDLQKYISIDPEIQQGQPVFTGTRVPVQTLFWHLEKGITIKEFLADFPGVTEEQAVGVLDIAGKLLSSGQLKSFYEAVA